MICYRDRQWCSQICGNLDCYRNLTPAESAAADRWWATWQQTGGEAPIDMRNMRDTKGCKASGGYMTPITAKVEP